MQIYLAPLEGLTPVTYRKVFRRHFDGVDKFFTPFVTATHTQSFQGRDRKEFQPFQSLTVPQLMAKNAEVFIPAARAMKAEGYEEINLNLGCPAPTAVTKGRGSGMLADPTALEAFFDEVFETPNLPGISIKTRIGLKDPSEAEALADVFAQYPFTEVIVHPRVREEYYAGQPHWDAFACLKERIKVPICYNGDLWTVEDVHSFLDTFPDVDRLMIGRGLLADPSLARQIQGGAPLSMEELRTFMEDLKISYKEVLSGDRDVLFKLIDLWHYVGRNFPEKEKELKAIRKAKRLEEYDAAVDMIFPSR